MKKTETENYSCSFHPANQDECLFRIATFNDFFSKSREKWRAKNPGYYKALEKEYKFIVEPNRSVLEIG